MWGEKKKKSDFSWTVILKWSFLGNQTFSLLQVAFFLHEKKNLLAALRMGLLHTNVLPFACAIYFT